MLKEHFWLDQNFDYRYLRNKIVIITTTVTDTDAATSAKYGVFFHAFASCVVEEAWESHRTAGSGAVPTLNIERLHTGIAPDSGDSTLQTNFSLLSTANTPVRSVAATDISKTQLIRGDRLCLADGGTLTSVNHVTVTVQVRYKD